MSYRPRYLLTAVAAFSISAPAFGESRQYDWLTNGVKSGSLVLDIAQDSTRTARFEFNDRGRGPSLTETVRHDEHGRTVALTISGHSYMGAEVCESFDRDEAGVRWSTTLDRGSAPDDERFYLANDGTPEHTASLARALLAQPENAIALWPNGTARIERAMTLDLEGLDPPVTLYAISGLGYQPRWIWLNESDELFAQVSGSMGLVPRGRAEWFEPLRAAQQHKEKGHLRQLATSLTRELPQRFRLNRVHVVDVYGGFVLPNQALDVVDGRIKGFSPASDSFDGPVIDGGGRYVVPGLWDMHTHSRLDEGPMHVAGGVTAARDLGNNPANFRSVQGAFDSGEVIGPRLIPAGVVEGKSPYSAPIERLAQSADEAVAIVQSYHELGYPQVKIYSSLEPSWVRPVTDAAHARGMRVSGHVPAFMSAEQAVRQGFDEIQHIYFLFLNFLAGPQDDTRTPLRFTRVGAQAGDLDLDSAEVNAFLDLLAENKVVIDPTIGIVVEMLTHRSGTLSPSYRMIADHLPPTERRRMLAGRLAIDEHHAPIYAASADKALEMVVRLHERGITLVAGTDALPGFALHRELELYVQAGIPARDVLRLATLGAARVMGQGAETGSIEPGKRADMILLDENPLEDISALRRVRQVFMGTRTWNPDEIYAALGIRPF